jgi:hypothetical protein
MQAAGIKTNHIEVRIVTAAADDYLAQHRDDLIAQAAMTIDSVPSLRKLAEQEAKRRRRSPQVTTNGHRHTPWPAAVSVVHNSRPEKVTPC